MAENQYTRTELVLGTDNVRKLHCAKVAVFGIGGVGGYCCDALVRTGVMSIDLYDHDTVSLTNLNRQLIALHSTIGRDKVDVMAERLHDINPECNVGKYKMFYLPQNAEQVDLTQYDYVVDAIDTMSAKLELIQRCQELKVPVISAMGAGNKLDPTQLKVADIYKTTMCPLARIMRGECKKRGIKKLKVVYSTEEPIHLQRDEAEKTAVDPSLPRRDTPGSVSFVPAVMGMTIAGEVIRDLLKGHVKSWKEE